MARRRRMLQPPRRPLSFRICSSSRSRALFTYFSGGSRLQFSLPSSTHSHQRHSSAGPAPSRIRSVRLTLPLLPTVSPRLESPLRHSPSIPPQVQLQASASDVCKPGVRGVPQLTRVLDLEFFQLSRLCSPYVSSIITVAGLPTPLTAPLSSFQPYQLNIAASVLRRDSSHELDKLNKAPRLPSLPSSFTDHFDVGWIGLLE
ncbi:hypothetical protein Bca52824_047191 [Brassica carinata]|uniref:Uncharacterized protein n=1 Tax=Brassica carinata TaxID=52824 RepID=A0A8X7RGK0_BRACI|nr:hypothetical protein Bca52824_047191 [Brassica carinata]